MVIFHLLLNTLYLNIRLLYQNVKIDSFSDEIVTEYLGEWLDQVFIIRWYLTNRTFNFSHIKWVYLWLANHWVTHIPKFQKYHLSNFDENNCLWLVWMPEETCHTKIIIIIILFSWIHILIGDEDKTLQGLKKGTRFVICMLTKCGQFIASN